MIFFGCHTVFAAGGMHRASCGGTWGKCFKASRWNYGVTGINSPINRSNIPDKPVRTRSRGRGGFIDLFVGSLRLSTANRLTSGWETWQGELACCAMHLPIWGGKLCKDYWLEPLKFTSYSQLVWNIGLSWMWWGFMKMYVNYTIATALQRIQNVFH